MPHNVRIQLGAPRDVKIEIDGHNVGSCVEAVTVHQSCSDLPKITLEMCVGATVSIDNALVLLDDKTRETLINLGWTPPAGE